MDKKPEAIGPYTIHEELGRGGMSIVYRATDTRTQKAVALKVLPREFAHNPTYLNRFVREGENAIRLQHANIVPVLEAGQADGYYYIAMEWATGGTLSERIKKQNGPLPDADVVTILRQVAAALDYAHSLNFLHRDIKPSNIMFGEDGRAMLADFGVAKDMTSEHTMVTMPGFSVGTPAYMSPEQARGDLDIDRRADVYSLGVVAYALLTGRMPFEADSQLVLLRKIVDEMPKPPEYANPRIHPGAAYVLKCVLSKDPNARYSTASEFVHALTQSMVIQNDPGMESTIPYIPVEFGKQGRASTAPPIYGGRPTPPPGYAPLPPPGYAPSPPTGYGQMQAAPSKPRYALWAVAAIGLTLLAIIAYGVFFNRTPETSSATPPAVVVAPETTPVSTDISQPTPESAPEESPRVEPTVEATAPVVAEPLVVVEPPSEASADTLTLRQPSAETVLDQQAVIFEWTSDYPLSSGQGLELIFWPQTLGEDGWRNGRSPSGVRRLSGDDGIWRAPVDLFNFSRSQTDGFFVSGDYFWGIVAVELEPYQRLSLLGERRTFTYQPGEVEVASAANSSPCTGECDRE